MRLRYTPFVLGTALVALTLLGSSGFAQSTPDPVDLGTVSAGHGKVRLTVTAGSSGAPAGFQVTWMSSDQFAALGGVWPATLVPGQGFVDFTGTGTLNTWGSAVVDFALSPNEALDVEIGDTRGETGVDGTVGVELAEVTEYVFVARALGEQGAQASPLSVTRGGKTTKQGANCTYTIGYWKNHTGAWPVASLQLGSVTYTAAQLLSILQQPVTGNGLVSMAHQLIGAKLNIANGANPTSITSIIASADALVGGLVVPPVGAGYLAPSGTSSTTQSLDDFNNGILGPGHCGSVPARVSTWGQVKLRAR